MGLNETFKALADPLRREIVNQLRDKTYSRRDFLKV